MFQGWAFCRVRTRDDPGTCSRGACQGEGPGKQLGRLKVTVQTERETVLTKENKSGLRMIASASGAR
jgi:hypothetical protein